MKKNFSLCYFDLYICLLPGQSLLRWRNVFYLILKPPQNVWLFKNINGGWYQLIEKISNPLTVFVDSITVGSFAEKIKTFIATCCLPIAVKVHINTRWLQSGLITGPVSVSHPPFIGPNIFIIGLQEQEQLLTWSLASFRKYQKNPARSKKYS